MCMDCKTVQERIVQFIYGELSASELKRIADHLAECNLCQEEHQLIKKMLNLLKSWENEEPSHEVRMRLWEKLQIDLV